jgi:hypothetical protein
MRAPGQAVQGGLGNPDEAPAAPAAPGFDQAAAAQIGERLAQGHGRHAEGRRQLRFGRELFAVREQPEGDGAAQPPHHCRGTSGAVVERREDRVPSGTDRRGHGCPLPGSAQQTPRVTATEAMTDDGWHSRPPKAIRRT